jgi:hypothetical protein
MPFAGYGASSDFTIRTLVGSDTLPPTTPILTSVTPVSTAQIDVVWSAATDNFIFGGYQVFRDSVQIATTTLTTYSDSGLLASTPYTYSVRAFDSVFNYSTTSNALATSTFAPTPTSTTSIDSTATYGSKSGLSLQEFTIVPEQYNATFFWKTTTFAKFDLRWGRSTSYELGFVSHELLRREHTTQVADLDPGTVYEFELVGYDRFGKQYTLKRGQFTTESAPDTTATANVSGLKAYVVGDTVHLSWVNPSETDFSRVRIMRSHLFFPLGTHDGFLSYEDHGTSFTDRGALTHSKIQYYTVFTIDTSGNMSSGAVIAVVAGGHVITDEETGTTDVSTTTLVFDDFEFIQEGTQKTSQDLSAEDSFLVRIAYTKLPPHLKTITMTIGEASDTASYLLRINNDKTYYEAVIPADTYAGKKSVAFSVYDFETKTLERVAGFVSFHTSGIVDTTTALGPLFTTVAVQSEVVTLIGFLCIFIFLVCIMLLRTLFRK